jgi:hypothetical protein
MKTTLAEVLILIGLTAVAGVIAAVRWHKSTGVPVDPGWDGINTIEQAGGPEQANQAWTVGMMVANSESGRINRQAAWWAAIAAVLAALSGVAALFLPPSH